MPLARIITSVPDRALAVAERLRREGYMVETVPPDAAPPGAADIELRIDGVRGAQVLKEVASRFAGRDIDVYIAAGALHSTRALVRNSSPAPHAPNITDTMNGVAAGLQNKRDLLAKALREQRLLLRQERNAARQRLRHGDPNVPVETVTHEEVSSAQFGTHTPAGLEEHSTAAADVSRSEILAPEPPQFEVQHAGSSDELPIVKPEPQVAPLAQSLASFKAEAASLEDAAKEPVPVLAGSTPVPTSDSPGRRANVVPGQDVRSNFRWHRRNSVRVVIPGARRLSRRAREWRAAVLISGVFAGVLMLAWGVVTRGPVSPLPKSFSAQAGVGESVPFGAVPITPADTGGTVRQQAQKAAVHSPAVAGTAHSPSAAPNHEVESAKRVMGNKAERKRPLARVSSDGDIAEDQVIYHRPAANPQPTGNEKASLKKFSD